MDDHAARRDAVAILLARHVPPWRAAHLRDERAERLLHVLDLEVFVIGELPVEAEHGDAPFVHDSRIDFAVAAVVGNHLAAPREPDVRAVVAAIVVLELLAVPAAVPLLDPAAEARLRQPRAAPHLDVVAAREVELLVVEPPRHVDVHPAHTVVIMGNRVHHLRNESSDVGAGRVGEILADRPARVRESIRE